MKITRCEIILAGIAVMLGMVLALTFIELRASDKLLHRLKILKPGMNLDLVKDQLGPLMHEKPAFEIEHWSSIKDPSYLQDKKLFWFYAATPPCRVIEVVTDTNNVVLFVTWQNL